MQEKQYIVIKSFTMSIHTSRYSCLKELKLKITSRINKIDKYIQYSNIVGLSLKC